MSNSNVNKKCHLWALVFCACQLLAHGYRNIRLEDNLCADRLLVKLKHQFKDPTVTLREERDSGAIITQRWNTTLPGAYASNRINYDCKFTVLGSDDPQHNPRGIYVLLKRLHFRTNEKNECLDYIQFSGGNRSPSERICAHIGGINGSLITHEYQRDVSVHIHIDKTKMITEPLEMLMVLTTHGECKYTGDFLCDPADQKSCISRYFVRDNVTNCMPPCRDELSCHNVVLPAAEVDATSVAISAITSLIFTMLGVCFCIWICWKYWNCITVQEATARRQQRARQQRSSHHHHQTHNGEQRNVPVIELSATAPTFSVVLPEPDLESQNNQQTADDDPSKDLPPSYESLFPDR